MRHNRFLAFCRRHLIWLCLLWTPPCLAYQVHMHNQITGISGLPLDNALLRLNILARDLGPSPTAKQQYGLYSQGIQAIKIAIQPYGYFEPIITKNLVKKQNRWFATYHVIPGPAIRIKNSTLTITGAGSQQPFFVTIKNKFPIHRNDKLNTQLYQNTKDILVETAINHGFLTSHFVESKLEINTRTHTATINIHFDTGSQYAFGKTSFSPSPLANSFLQRYISYPLGSPFNNTSLRDLQDALGNSRYFDQVIVSPKLPDKDSHQTLVPISVQLTPKKSQIYKLSLGYGTNNGIRSSAQLELPFINTYGHQVQTSLTVSKKFAMSDANQDKITIDTDYPTEAILQIKYIIPGNIPTKEMFTIETSTKRSSFYTEAGRRPFTNQNITGKYINNLHKWKQITSFTYLHESSRKKQAKSSQFDLLSPAIQWTKLNSDSFLLPSKGSSLNFSLRAVNNTANSHYNFLIIRAKARKLLTFSLKNRIILHSELGYLTLKNQDKVPKTYQLLTGGATSLRGFDYLAIGPGTRMGVAGVELQRILHNNWISGIFTEGGGVYRDMKALKHPSLPEDKTRVGQGFSLQKQTPIGSFNLSYARAKHWVAEENHWKWKWKWHFSIGTEL